MEFRYQAVNSQGYTVSGIIGAGGEREAARLLRQQEPNRPNTRSNTPSNLEL